MGWIVGEGRYVDGQMTVEGIKNADPFGTKILDPFQDRSAGCLNGKHVGHRVSVMVIGEGRRKNGGGPALRFRPQGPGTRRCLEFQAGAL